MIPGRKEIEALPASSAYHQIRQTLRSTEETINNKPGVVEWDGKTGVSCDWLPRGKKEHCDRKRQVMSLATRGASPEQFMQQLAC